MTPLNPYRAPTARLRRLTPILGLLLPLLGGCSILNEQEDGAELRLIQYGANAGGSALSIGGSGVVGGCRVDAAPDLLPRLQAALSGDACSVVVQPEPAAP